jgi:hypothetical protein
MTLTKHSLLMLAAVLAGCATTDDAPPSVGTAGGRQWYGINGSPVIQQQLEADLAGCQREADEALDMSKAQRDRMMKTGIPDMDARTQEAMNLHDKNVIKGCMATHGYLWFKQY